MKLHSVSHLSEFHCATVYLKLQDELGSKIRLSISVYRPILAWNVLIKSTENAVRFSKRGYKDLTGCRVRIRI